METSEKVNESSNQSPHSNEEFFRSDLGKGKLESRVTFPFPYEYL
jgi:hypothetical protein